MKKQWFNGRRIILKKRGVEIYKDNYGKRFGGNGSNILVHIKGKFKGEAICLAAHWLTL